MARTVPAFIRVGQLLQSSRPIEQFDRRTPILPRESRTLHGHVFSRPHRSCRQRTIVPHVALCAAPGLDRVAGGPDVRSRGLPAFRLAAVPNRQRPSVPVNSKSGWWMPKRNSRSRSTCSSVMREVARSRPAATVLEGPFLPFWAVSCWNCVLAGTRSRWNGDRNTSCVPGNFVINPGATDNTEVVAGAICRHEAGRLVVWRPAHSPSAGGSCPC